MLADHSCKSAVCLQISAVCIHLLADYSCTSAVCLHLLALCLQVCTLFAFFTTGNPDDRQGCSSSRTDECRDDAQCAEDEVCREHNGSGNTCQPTCNFLKCGPGAVCVARNHIGKCTCPKGIYKGDPYNSGCQKVKCIENDDCPANEYCDRLSYTCRDVCKRGICGVGAICLANNHAHVCQCPPYFIPSPSPQIKCTKQREGEVCPQGQCQAVCSSNRQCSPGQTCRRGICENGCASNSDCSASGPFRQCINGKCRDACKVACGPNSLCSQSGQCECPEGFAGVPTAKEGCVRIPSACTTPANCPEGTQCYNGYCMPNCESHGECARGEQCNRKGMCLKLCHTDKNCLQGEICVDKFCDPGCHVDSDCRGGEHCSGGQCMCSPGFINTPDGCRDIDECENDICSPGMKCINTKGSYTCKCPANMFQDAASGLCKKPDGCRSDNDCDSERHGCIADPLQGGARRCLNPCDHSFCTKRATCQVIGHKAFCSCPPMHRGDPTDPNIGCYKVGCDGDDDCADSLACDQNALQCADPCKNIQCGRGSCRTVNHQPVCHCQTGYEQSKTNGLCVDVDECRPGSGANGSPCHPTARCANVPGSFKCTCRDGQVGDAYSSSTAAAGAGAGKGCQPKAECLSHSDCPAAAACSPGGRCVDPCDGGACGDGADCQVKNHQPRCQCPPRTTGDPLQKCSAMECVDNPDCPSGRSCVDNHCQNVCSFDGVCGANR